MMGQMDIIRLNPGQESMVIAGSELFDHPPTEEWARRFLSLEGHHLLFAMIEGAPVGFISGVETAHPDKGTEMFLYELGVHPHFRLRGIATALVQELTELARRRRCYGMWVGVDPDNAAALGTYRAAGAEPPEPCVTFTWTFDPPG